MVDSCVVKQNIKSILEISSVIIFIIGIISIIAYIVIDVNVLKTFHWSYILLITSAVSYILSGGIIKEYCY